MSPHVHIEDHGTGQQHSALALYMQTSHQASGQHCSSRSVPRLKSFILLHLDVVPVTLNLHSSCPLPQVQAVPKKLQKDFLRAVVSLTPLLMYSTHFFADVFYLNVH